MSTHFPSDPTNYKELLSFMMHELRRIQEVLMTNATQLSLGIKGASLDAPRIRTYVPLVLEELYVFHAWLSIADFYLDPIQFAREALREVNLHGLFYKAVVNLDRRSKEKGAKIKLRGEGQFVVMAHPILSIVPYLLLDNSIKYCPTSGEIEIVLEQSGTQITVRVTSMGPRVSADELPTLTQAGVRGKLAEQVSRAGHGQGLALLAAICRYHKATLNISSDPDTSVPLCGIPYSPFVVEMQFAKVA